MRHRGNTIRGLTLRLLTGVLLSLPLLGACRIRRERPTPQPAPQRSAILPGDSATGQQPAVEARPPPAAIPTQPLPDAPARAPEGVLVVAATTLATNRHTIDAALSSVRTATRSLLNGTSGLRAAATGLIPFEQAVAVPIADGAPSRQNGGRPQCDVVLVDARGRRFGVGAVSDLESPARLALGVLDFGWSFVVGDAVQDLATKIGVPTQHWSRHVDDRETKVDTDVDLSHASPVPDAGMRASAPPGSEPPDAGLVVATTDAGPPPVPLAPPSTAALLLRDRAGQFFAAAEDCGAEGAPFGQLTALTDMGATLFVGEHGAVFVTGGRKLAPEARHAERIYRRLAVLQAPRVVADWGLRTSTDATLVVVISRTDAAIASPTPVVWARNQAVGESTTLDTSTADAAPVAAPPIPPAASEERKPQTDRPFASAEPHADAGTTPSATPPRPAQPAPPRGNAPTGSAAQSRTEPRPTPTAAANPTDAGFPAGETAETVPAVASATQPRDAGARTAKKDAGPP